jgi:hypothetical protein
MGEFISFDHTGKKCHPRWQSAWDYLSSRAIPTTQNGRRALHPWEKETMTSDLAPVTPPVI